MGFYHPQCPPVRPHGMRPSCPGPCAPLGVPQRASPTEDVERRHAQAAGKRRRLPKDASTTKQSCGGRLAYQIWSFPGTKDTRCIPNTTTPYDIPRTRRQLAARQLRILICTCCRFFFPTWRRLGSRTYFSIDQKLSLRETCSEVESLV